MKPFKLQTVLDYRKRLEDIAQHKLFEVKTVFKTIEEKLEQEKQLFNNLLEQREEMQSGGVAINDLIRHEAWITSLQTNIEAIAKNLKEKKKLVDQAQDKLLHRSKEKQIMQRLKEEQNKNWRKYLDKKEAAMLDEIAIARHDTEIL